MHVPKSIGLDHCKKYREIKSAITCSLLPILLLTHRSVDRKNPVLFGNFKILQKLVIRLPRSEERDFRRDHMLTMPENCAHNISPIDIVINPINEKARLAAFPEMIPAASQPGQL